MTTIDLSIRVTQEDFGALVGISQPAVSGLLANGVIQKEGTAAQWLLAYCARLREQAAGRLGADGGALDLVQERAALAREQRIAYELKNAVTRGEFAPIGVLADVLGLAAGAVADRFDQVEGSLRKACPEISDDVLLTVLGVVASSRNEWLRATARLVDSTIDRMQPEDDATEPADAWDAPTGDDDELSPLEAS
jgi:phage terminase Nu1 subunit (DNA packaging protein)